MTWAILIPLITQYGLPLVGQLVELWSKGEVPTAADFANLQAMANKNATDNMLIVLTQQGIDPNSAQGQALLALTK